MVQENSQTATPTGPAPQFVADKLRRLRKSLKTWLFIDGAWRVLLVVLLFVGISLLLDWFFHMDTAQRLLMLVLGIAAALLVSWRWLGKPLSQKISDDALVLSVEDQSPELHESLISAMQFSRTPPPPHAGVSRELVDATISQGMQNAAAVDFTRVIDRRKFGRNLSIGLAMVAILAGVGILVGSGNEVMHTWFERNVLLADTKYPQHTFLIVQGLDDRGRYVLPRGARWNLIVDVDQQKSTVPADEVYVEFRPARQRVREILETVEKQKRFKHEVSRVDEPFEFRLRGGDALTGWIPMVLIDPPVVAKLKLEVSPPAYTGGNKIELVSDGPYKVLRERVLRGGSVRVTGQGDKDLSSAVITRGEWSKEMTITGGKNFEIEIPAAQLAGGSYSIRLVDREKPVALSSKFPTRFDLELINDDPPTVRLALSGIRKMVTRQARIPLKIDAEDKFAITKISIPYRWLNQGVTSAESGDGTLEGASGVLVPPLSYIDKDDGKAVTFKLPVSEAKIDYVWDIEGLNIPVDSQFRFTAEVTDNDNITKDKPVGKSLEIILDVVSENVLLLELQKREQVQGKQFGQLLKSQRDLLTQTRALAADLEGKPAESKQSQGLAELYREQKAVETQLTAIVARLREILEEAQNNRVEVPGGPLESRLRLKVIDPLAGLFTPGAASGTPNQKPEVQLAWQQLDQSRLQIADAGRRDGSLKEAIASQQRALSVMEEVRKSLSESPNFQQALNMLIEIEKKQKDVSDSTELERQRRIESLTPPTKQP